MSARPTPRPWHVFDQAGVIEIQDAKGEPVVFWTGFDRTERSHATHLANARLIVEAVNEHLAAPNRTARNSAKDADGVAAAPAPSTEGHNGVLQLMGDRCQCARCEADRQAAAGVSPSAGEVSPPSDADALQTAGKNVKESGNGR